MVDLNFDNLKIAVAHDSLVQFGGAERVLNKILTIFPRADLYTSINGNDPSLSHIRKRLKRSWEKPLLVDPYGFLAKIYINSYWQSLNLRKYDIVISISDELSSKAVITGPETLHLCYCLTPPRYLYPEYSSWDGIKSTFSLKTKLILNFLREEDFVSSRRPDLFVAISGVVGKRIKKYYGRESVVIYPPVDIPLNRNINKNRGDYYIFVGFLDKRKGVELAVRAFNKMKENLVVVGKGSQLEYLKKIAGKNIKFTGFITEEEKNDLLSGARGFIYPSIEEDFGIAPIEAMGYGIPVFAYRSGALVETIKEGSTGSFFSDFTEESFIKSFEKFKKKKFNAINIRKHSLKFSANVFVNQLKLLLNKEYKKMVSI